MPTVHILISMLCPRRSHIPSELSQPSIHELTEHLVRIFPECARWYIRSQGCMDENNPVITLEKLSLVKDTDHVT